MEHLLVKICICCFPKMVEYIDLKFSEVMPHVWNQQDNLLVPTYTYLLKLCEHLHISPRVLSVWLSNLANVFVMNEITARLSSCSYIYLPPKYFWAPPFFSYSTRCMTFKPVTHFALRQTSCSWKNLPPKMIWSTFIFSLTVLGVWLSNLSCSWINLPPNIF